MGEERRKIVAELVMDLSQTSADTLTEEVLREMWSDRLDDRAFSSGEREELLSVSIRKLSPDAQLRAAGVCGECVLGICKAVECRELVTLNTFETHDVDWFNFCPRCGQRLPFRGSKKSFGE